MTKATIVLNKDVTVMEDLGNGRTAVYSVKHRDLPGIVAQHGEIEVTYAYGQAKRRVKQLTELGFERKETIWFNDYAPYAEIREIWAKGVA